MFGFSKKEKEERQKAEAIEHGLDLFGSEFRIALATTADVYGMSAYPSGDSLKEARAQKRAAPYLNVGPQPQNGTLDIPLMVYT